MNESIAAIERLQLLEPLHDAALSGHSEIVQLLLDKGAGIEAKDDESSSTALYHAASWGRREVAALLIEKGANVNARNKAGHTPLHAALANEHKEIAALLKARGGVE